MKIDSVSNDAARNSGNNFEQVNRQEARQAARQERIEARQERLAAREAGGNQPSVPTGPIPVEPNGGNGSGEAPIPLTLLEKPTPIDPGVGGFNFPIQFPPNPDDTPASPFPFNGQTPIDPGFGGGTIFPPSISLGDGSK